MTSTTRVCYCGNERDPKASSSPSSASLRPQPSLCQPCATRRLSSQITRHRAASEKHAQKKLDCRRRLLEIRLPLPSPENANEARVDSRTFSRSRPLPDPGQINARASELKRRLDASRGRSDAAALRLTAKTMENDEREERLRSGSDRVDLARERLDRMTRCLLTTSRPTSSAPEARDDAPPDADGTSVVVGGGGLEDALVAGTRRIRSLRFRLACRAFDMHRLDAGEPRRSEGGDGDARSSKGGAGGEGATGVGRIGGLPLPHAGPALYGVLPPFVLAASLRSVASLTQMVARCLGVVLPHPIMVCCRECSCGAIYDFGSDVIDVANDSDGRYDDNDEDHTGNSKQSLCPACRNDGTSEGTSAKVTRQTKLLASSSSSSSSSGQSQRKSSLLSLVGSSARRAIAITTSATSRAITQMHHSSASGDVTPSVNLPAKSLAQNTNPAKTASNGNSGPSERLARRIDRASFAYLRENYDKSATEYVLDPPRWSEDGNRSKETTSAKTSDRADGANPCARGDRRMRKFCDREEFCAAEEAFATGVQLLQNDVAALCFRAGVDASALWPAESMLLNLHSLRRRCRRMAEADSSR